MGGIFMIVSQTQYSSVEAFVPILKSYPHNGVLGQIGSLIVRLARNDAEIEAAQNLRQQVFREQSYQNGSVLDYDAFDPFCDHLIVIDASFKSAPIVGTYRLLRHEQAVLAGEFYSQHEFDIQDLIRRLPHRRLVELGRSCVLPDYRTKRTIELLWKGIWAFCVSWNIDLLCGCASFLGTSPALHALPFSFLHHYALAKNEWRVTGKNALSMDMMPQEAVHTRAALGMMPPLIKGYLRLGAMIGDGAVIDFEFNTTDVFIILPIERISQRYLDHFSA
jgi:L-ornithine Nalpha-acyltransferase